MTSPFPGMDTSLEASWGDVHARLIIYASEQLQSRFPPGLRARAEKRLVVESADSSRPIQPDLHIIERARPTEVAAHGEGGGVAVAVEVAEPLLIRVEDEPETQRYLEILDIRAGRRVVTALEFLSPSNKAPGLGRMKYLQKQQELAGSGIHSVEIDLLRGGHHVLAAPEHGIPAAHRSAFAACVRRASNPGVLEYYRAPLRERLPAIRILLRADDRDVALDLQALVDRCYQTGAYGDDLDYRADPVPPLDPADAVWADAVLRVRGLR